MNEKLDISLFTKPVTFMRGVASIDDFPLTNMPEFAFAGRSNVGKSSLINAILNRSKLARVSNTPGRTREINFFNLADQIIFSDLPGYGYAVISKKIRADWDYLITAYLSGRPQLKFVFLLIDSRFGHKEIDKKIMRILDEAAVSYRVVLTKTDKINNLSEVIENAKKTNEKFAAAYPSIIATSSKNNTGIEEIKTSILELLNYGIE